jgi:hypothetical protein
MLRRFQGCGQRLDLRLHQPAGGRRQQSRQRLDRRMRPMRAGKRVGDQHVAQLRELLRELPIVLFFLGVEADVL